MESNSLLSLWCHLKVLPAEIHPHGFGWHNFIAQSFPQHYLPSTQAIQGGSRKRKPHTEAVVFLNIILEVIFHSFCHIPFMRGKSVRVAHTKGKEIG
jgi:hypothetical protein